MIEMKKLIIVIHILLTVLLVGCATKGDYVGELKDGKYDGPGTLTFPDGTKHVGEFMDGKKNGQGTLTFPNVKEFKDGEYDGKGTLILSDGSKYVGKWKDDEPWNVTVYDIDGNILRRRIVNGVLK